MAAPAAERRRPRDSRRPRPALRRCCYRSHLADSQCLPLHSGGRWVAEGERRVETKTDKEETRGREGAPLVMRGSLSPSPSPNHKLETEDKTR